MIPTRPSWTMTPPAARTWSLGRRTAGTVPCRASSSSEEGRPMGRVVHFEIHATDMDAAERFYTSVFGWTARRTEAAGRDYRLLITGQDGTPGINGALLARRGEAPAAGEPVSGFVC